MAVLLSPFAGSGAQFFDNNGVPLAGGKIYSYAAGTTTPQVTYTAQSPIVARTNPIILDSAGRLPSGGELWLAEGLYYKFIVKTSADVTLATYDNIIGINSTTLSYSGEQEIQTATAGQTVFTLTTMTYQPNTGSLSVFVDGLNQYGPGAQYAYEETNSNTVTFNSGLSNGAKVKFTTSTFNNGPNVNASQVAYTADFSGAVPSNVETKLSECVSVKDFGAVGDGTTDDTAAIAAAHATGKPVFYPYGTYKHVGYFPDCEGGIIGEGWSTNIGALTTKIVFYNCTDTTKGAITPKQTTPRSQFFRVENVMIEASSWNNTTGCLGYGLSVGVPVRMTNVYVGNFKKSNMFFYAPTGTGPYESMMVNVYSAFAGQHGVLVGNGANVLTFIGYQGKWSGAPSFGVAPSVAGSYDGMYVAATSDGVSGIPPYNPESLVVIGGDCSYNSRYGWNFNTLMNSGNVCAGYAEGNLVKEARCGNDVYNCRVAFSGLLGETQGFLNDQTYQPSFYANSFFIGGKQVHPPNVYTFIANPSQQDQVNGAAQNAPTRYIYISRNNSATSLGNICSNITPDFTSVNVATETVYSLMGAGTYAIGIGTGARHLKITDNRVRLPDLYYQATDPGWGSGALIRTIATSEPNAGSWTQGDIVFNLTPTPGAYVGWVCTASGTPGTWKGFGLIAT